MQNFHVSSFKAPTSHSDPNLVCALGFWLKPKQTADFVVFGVDAFEPSVPTSRAVCTTLCSHFANQVNSSHSHIVRVRAMQMLWRQTTASVVFVVGVGERETTNRQTSRTLCGVSVWRCVNKFRVKVDAEQLSGFALCDANKWT